ncbi:Parkin co-regulated protein [Phytophthora infestans]|uniref:Parkin co-regulated protein n=1 Tax=Phytophthora infestans TaxID=4787 RepID=A0A833WP87_PHYIN|nr:Parkin co-regulated protein [Phytophthora infestans]
MASRDRAADSQVITFDFNESGRAAISSASSSRPNTSGGRFKKSKLSEFRQCLEKEELPLLIVTCRGVRRVTWTANLEQLDFAHLLPICLSGLQETLEPYPSFAFDAAMGLLESGRRGTRVLKAWTANLEQLDFAHLLPICLSGLQETLEPYPSFAFDAAMGLLESGRRGTRVLKALPQVVQQLKSALNTREKAVAHRVLLVLQQLAVCEDVGSELADYYRSLLPLCNILQDKHLGTGDSATKELVTEALETLEAYGRDDAHLMIQQYVPAFQSCCGA